MDSSKLAPSVANPMFVLINCGQTLDWLFRPSMLTEVLAGLRHMEK